MSKEKSANMAKKNQGMKKGELITMKRKMSTMKNPKRMVSLVLALLMFLGSAMAEAAVIKNPDEVERLSQSVLILYVYDENGREIGTGSGEVVFDNITLVTNYHVIEGAYTILAESDDGYPYYLSHVIAVNKDKDLAILRFLAPTIYQPLEMSVDPLRRGEEVMAIGSPEGLKNTVSMGIIGSTESYGIYDFRHTAPISPGNSGGALFNQDGKLIGITSATHSDTYSQNLNFAISAANVVELYNSWDGETVMTVEDFAAMDGSASTGAGESSQDPLQIMIPAQFETALNGRRQNVRDVLAESGLTVEEAETVMSFFALADLQVNDDEATLFCYNSDVTFLVTFTYEDSIDINEPAMSMDFIIVQIPEPDNIEFFEFIARLLFNAIITDDTDLANMIYAWMNSDVMEDIDLGNGLCIHKGADEHFQMSYTVYRNDISNDGQTIEPTAPPTSEPTATPTSAPPTSEPTATPTSAPTATPTAEPTPTPTAPPTATPMKEGHGTMTLANGAVVEGEWKEDQLVDHHAIVTYPDGSVYEGGWKNEERNGHGTLTFSNGSVFEGEWAYNLPTGDGQTEEVQSAAYFAAGDIYRLGVGESKNIMTAISWYEKAAAMDNILALNWIGYLYVDEDTLDTGKAVEWFSRSAQLGSGFGMFYLGYFHENGIGMEKDMDKAIEWYQKSAATGFQSAIDKLNELGLTP